MSEDRPPPPPAPLPLPLTLSAGFLMGAADSVPGVSGGTIALILGVYRRLIDSIAEILRLPARIRSRDGRRRLAAALRFLVPLAIGIGAAYFLGTKLLVGPTDQPGLLRKPASAPLCYAFFFGLVLFSLREPWRRIDHPRVGHWALAALAGILTAWAVGLDHANRTPENWMLVYGGALAVAVMLLPGISGSLLLLTLGQYTTVARAVHDADLGRLAFLSGGIVIGLCLFVPLLRRLLHHHRGATLAALTGLMAGSLRALWPWKSHYDLGDVDRGRMVNVGIAENWPWVVLALALGAAATWLLTRLERRIERSTARA